MDAGAVEALIDAKFILLEGRLNTLINELAHHEGRLIALEAELAHHEGRLIAHEAELAHHEGRLIALEAELLALDHNETKLALVDLPPPVSEPPDAYSFISKGFEQGRCSGGFVGVSAGLLVFVFQLAGLFFLLAGIILPRFNRDTADDFDNPDKFTTGAEDLNEVRYMAKFMFNPLNWKKTFPAYIPANNSSMVIATQIFTMIFFALSYDASAEDVMNSFVVKNWNLRNFLGNFCRFVQGSLACLTTVILIMNLNNATDILLNVTAVNLISEFDGKFFQMAGKGWFGGILKAHTEEMNPDDRITFKNGAVTREYENTKVSKSEYKVTPASYWCSVFWVVIMSLVIVVPILIKQKDDNEWVTDIFRVHFDAPAELRSFSGCYGRTMSNTSEGKYEMSNRRYDYTHIRPDGADPAKIFYSADDKRWDFILSTSEHELGHSSSTVSFDIATDFGNPWLDRRNKPLELVFIENKNNSKTAKDFLCHLREADGKCDKELNEFAYQYDGGDCCATTCNGDQCGILDRVEEFGGTLDSTIGYPDCVDKGMMNLNITLEFEEIQDSGIWEIFRNFASCNIELECNDKKVLSGNVDERVLLNEAQLVTRISRGAACSLFVRGFEPIFKTIVTWAIPDKSGITMNVIQKNVIPTDVGDPNEKLFIPEIDFSSRNLKGTIPKELGLLPIELEKLDLSDNLIGGMIPPELGNIDGLKFLKLDNNDLFGTIPREIFTPPVNNIDARKLEKDNKSCKSDKRSKSANAAGCSSTNPPTNPSTNPPINPPSMSKDLKSLDLNNNNLEGAIPSEIGNARDLTHLRLRNNTFSGSLPSSFGQLSNLVYLDLSDNKLTVDLEVIKKLTGLKTLYYKQNDTHFSDNCTELRIRLTLDDDDCMEKVKDKDDKDSSGPKLTLLFLTLFTFIPTFVVVW